MEKERKPRRTMLQRTRDHLATVDATIEKLENELEAKKQEREIIRKEIQEEDIKELIEMMSRNNLTIADMKTLIAQ